jgi:hypothetical protein
MKSSPVNGLALVAIGILDACSGSGKKVDPATAADAAVFDSSTLMIDASPGSASPVEACNLQDDDGNGYCDDILGCRIGVDRSYDTGTGQHFYTTTDAEMSLFPYVVEQQDYFYLYQTPLPGLVPFYRCNTGTGHLYTTDDNCDGTTMEGTLGYIATSPGCGAVPLYALWNARTGDRLYTTSSSESSSAQGAGYTLLPSPGYVWAADCGGPNCVWPNAVAMVGSTTTAAVAFPTAWYGFPIDGTKNLSSISGTLSVTQPLGFYSEELFVLQYLPSGPCTAGPMPASTPQFGPPGAVGIGNFIVKAPSVGTFKTSINLTLPGGLPVTNCLLLGLNGGSVDVPHDVTSAANLSLSYTAPQPSAQSTIGVGGEFCFGQSIGCQAATTDSSKSFAYVTPITTQKQLVALYGDISDSTFDGTYMFGAPPTGAWSSKNDFYIYHGAECSSFGVASGIAGPGDYYASIPGDAVHLLSVPLSGGGISVTTQPVFQSFSNTTLMPGDCLVTLWGMESGGGFDNETQVLALTSP